MMIIPAMGRGGAERVVARLSSQWKKEGRKVGVVVFETLSHTYPLDVPIIDIKVASARSLSTQAFNLLVRAWKIRRIIKSRRPARIISFTEGANLPTILACLGLPERRHLTVSIRINPEHISPLQKFLARILYPLANKVTCNSADCRIKSMSAFNIEPDKIAVIHNPIEFSPSPQLGPDSSTPPVPGRYVLGVGRLHVQKGFDILIRAFAKAHIEQTTQLVLVGEGEERANLQSLARSLRVEHRIRFMGLQDDLAPYYRHGSCFVLPSRFEGWPNALNEALSFKMPCIASDCDFGPREIIIHEKTGILFPPGDIEALKNALEVMLSDSHRAYEMGQRGYEAARPFSIQAISQLWFK